MGRVSAARKTRPAAWAKWGRASTRLGGGRRTRKQPTARSRRTDSAYPMTSTKEAGSRLRIQTVRRARAGSPSSRRTRTYSRAVAASAAALASSTSAGPSPRPGIQASPWVSSGTSGKNRSDEVPSGW